MRFSLVKPKLKINFRTYPSCFFFCVHALHFYFLLFIMHQQMHIYTGYTQKNGAVSKVNKKFISHLARAQRTPSAAATVQDSHALPAVRFSCLLRGRGASFQDGVAAG